MAGFNYEKGLLHQELAIDAVIRALAGATVTESKDGNGIQIDDRILRRNIQSIQQLNRITDVPLSDKRVLDIAMETGTGKTYTYTKTMFELHRLYSVFKFIVVVPTLSIKAGTENFLKSTALAEHFRLDFEGRYGNTELELYLVQSQKPKKAKNLQHLPQLTVLSVLPTKRKSIFYLLMLE